VLLLGIHPVEDVLHPGEAVHAACDAAASMQIDVESAPAWRDFMVSGCAQARTSLRGPISPPRPSRLRLSRGGDNVVNGR
jgi:hypothetical protein